MPLLLVASSPRVCAGWVAQLVEQRTENPKRPFFTSLDHAQLRVTNIVIIPDFTTSFRLLHEIPPCFQGCSRILQMEHTNGAHRRLGRLKGIRVSVCDATRLPTERVVRQKSPWTRTITNRKA